jgi:hypothetical protein
MSVAGASSELYGDLEKIVARLQSREGNLGPEVALTLAILM